MWPSVGPVRRATSFATRTHNAQPTGECEGGTQSKTGLSRYCQIALRVFSFNPLTPRVKPWVIQSLLTFHSLDRTLSATIRWKAVEQYLTVVLFLFSILPSLEFWKMYQLARCTLKKYRHCCKSHYFVSKFSLYRTYSNFSRAVYRPFL